ncbi:MAG: molecular chaperone [Candidatus Eremiobacteraeota bacterium]|nr:molecular chaperone [Candidatus Eremiobacteraeota bacterium]
MPRLVGRLFALSVAFVFALGAPARANAVAVQPTKVFLTEHKPSDTFVLENRGTETLRVQVSSAAWDEGPKGEILTPTTELVFFPVLLTIPPHEKKTVRVGIANPAPTQTERAYRVFFGQLPSLQSQLGAQGVGIEMLQRVGVAIYYDPVKPVSKPELAVRTLKDGILTLAAGNTGNAHYVFSDVAIQGLDEHKGSVLAKQSTEGGVVFANHEVLVRFALDPRECRALHDVTATMHVPNAAPVKQTFSIPAGSSCPRA